jgi:hypothetical protein
MMLYGDATTDYSCTEVTYPLDEPLSKVKESRNRSDVAQMVPGGLGSQIFMTFGT